MTDDLMEELRIMANEHDDELCRYALSRFVLLEEAIDHYRKALSQSSSRIEALEARNKLLEQSQAAQALAGLGVNVVAAHNSGLAALKAACKEERLRAKKAEARIEALEAALRKGQYMRQRQKQYFKDRTQDNLVGSKQAEAAFDRALAGEKKDG